MADFPVCPSSESTMSVLPPFCRGAVKTGRFYRKVVSANLFADTLPKSKDCTAQSLSRFATAPFAQGSPCRVPFSTRVLFGKQLYKFPICPQAAFIPSSFHYSYYTRKTLHCQGRILHLPAIKNRPRRKPEAIGRLSVIDYCSSISVTTPEPTVRPPSRIAKRRPFSIAMGVISSTLITTLSPGMHISVPSGRVMMPVTSVVRK